MLNKFVVNIEDKHLKLNIHFFNKQLRSVLSPQNGLYFQDFQGSNLPNDCLVV